MEQVAGLQALATNIVVISVALLAVTIFAISAAWRGLLHYIRLISVQGRRDIANTIFWFYMASFAAFGAVIAMYYVGHDMMQIIVFFGMLALAAIGIVYSAFRFVWDILRNRKPRRFQRSKEPNVEELEKLGTLVYSTSVVNLALATFSFAFTVFGATDATVGTGIRPDSADDVNFSGWLLYAGTMAFLFGLMLLGAGKCVDFHRFLDAKRKGEEVRDSAPEEHGPTHQDEAYD